MNKIILEENEVFDFNSNQSDVEVAANNSAATTAMTELIKKVWELIDTISESSVNLSALGNENINSILGEIVKDEYVHIGQLEKILDFMVPEADNINTGEQQAKDELEEPVVEELPEDELPPDDINLEEE